MPESPRTSSPQERAHARSTVCVPLLAIFVAGACSVDRSVPQSLEQARSALRVESPPPLNAEPCRPGEGERSSSLGASTYLIDQVSYPCEVRATVAVVLAPDSLGSRPDPSYGNVLHTSMAEFLVDAELNSAGAPSVTVWSERGQYLRSIGTPGQGPGEFAGRASLRMTLDSHDRLYVRDGGRRLSIFSPHGEFVRLINDASVSSARSTFHVLDDGSLLSSGTVQGGDPGMYFHLADSLGQVVRSFGTIPPQPPGQRRRSPPIRNSYYGGGQTFWALPEAGQPYELQEWTTGGELVRTLRRDVEWATAHVVENDPLRHVFPGYTNIHVDKRGLLWVTLVVKDSNFTVVADPAENERIGASQTDVRFEVIDPTTATVLASGVIDTGAFNPLYKFVPRSNYSFRPVFSGNGLASIQVLNLELVKPR